MSRTQTWCQTPPSVTVRVKPSSVYTQKVRRALWIKVPGGRDTRSPPQDLLRHAQITQPPTIRIYSQEMASYLRLFDDDFIQDFLWMDCCCIIADKYLLAMAFVYFKRACFTIAEYTKKNFFLALYLAHTMEEDEEESKYEIFPWALGNNWRKQFPRFIKQRDKLWSRIDYRAAVSRRCCEEVMAIVPFHFVWQRERSEHHSGAQRQYDDQDRAHIHHGPSAPPVSCSVCNHGTRLEQTLGSCSSSRGSSAQTPNTTLPHPFTPLLTLGTTPPIATSSCRKGLDNKSHAQHSLCCCAKEVAKDESSCESSYDTAMDWIYEE